MREIKKAHRKLGVQYHPDKGGDQAKMVEINSAFDRLMRLKNPSRRV